MRIAIVCMLAVLGACGSSKKKAPDASVAALTSTNAQPSKTLVSSPAQEEACGQMIVVAWQGAAHAPENITRTEEQARERAEALLQRVERGDEFTLVAATESDGTRTKMRGGLFGVFTRDEFPSVYAELRESLFRLHVGQIGEIVRTQFGWVVLKRCVVEKLHLRHVLIRYQGAVNAGPEITRTRDGAMIFATALRRQIADDPTQFDTIARERSEDGFARNGGDMGMVARGTLDLDYENAAWNLQPGEISPAVETELGFFIIQRAQ